MRFLGYQDTINPNKNHQYFYKCYITGNVDFIYGSAGMALFEDCDIVFRYNANKNSGYVTAPKSDGVDYGLIFDDCRSQSRVDAPEASTIWEDRGARKRRLHLSTAIWEA